MSRRGGGAAGRRGSGERGGLLAGGGAPRTPSWGTRGDTGHQVCQRTGTDRAEVGGLAEAGAPLPSPPPAECGAGSPETPAEVAGGTGRRGAKGPGRERWAGHPGLEAALGHPPPGPQEAGGCSPARWSGPERSQRPPHGPERGGSVPGHRPVTHREALACQLHTDLSGVSLVLRSEVHGDGEGHQTSEESLQSERQRPGDTWERWGDTRQEKVPQPWGTAPPCVARRHPQSGHSRPGRPTWRLAPLAVPSLTPAP